MSLTLQQELEVFADQIRSDAIDQVSDQVAFGIYGCVMAYAKDCPELGVEILAKAARAYLDTVAHCHGSGEAINRGEELISLADAKVTELTNADVGPSEITREAIDAILIAYETYKR